MQDAWANGAAVLGVPVKATIKEVHKIIIIVNFSFEKRRREDS